MLHVFFIKVSFPMTSTIQNLPNANTMLTEFVSIFTNTKGLGKYVTAMSWWSRVDARELQDQRRRFSFVMIYYRIITCILVHNSRITNSLTHEQNYVEIVECRSSR